MKWQSIVLATSFVWTSSAAPLVKSEVERRQSEITDVDVLQFALTVSIHAFFYQCLY